MPVRAMTSVSSTKPGLIPVPRTAFPAALASRSISSDSSGSDAINQPLSERRAQAVSNEIQAQGVDAARITAKGYGSTQPVGDNSTAAGKAANRRVEVAIFANEKMQKAAKKGQL